MRLSARALVVLTITGALVAAASTAAAFPSWSATRSVVRAGGALASGDSPTALVLSRRGRPSAQLSFIEGAALLRLGRWGEAATAFASAVARSRDPELVRSALHNLAYASLRLADEGDPGEAGVHARASVAAGREALRLDPRVDGSRWNLALAQRLLVGQQTEGSPTPHDGGVVTVGGAGSGTAPSLAGAGPMTGEEAGRLLDALRSGEVESLRGSLARTFESTRDLGTTRGPPW